MLIAGTKRRPPGPEENTMNASQSAARRHTIPALYLGSEGRPASDRGGCVDSRAAGERRQL
jgi:hypothetical protein